MSATAAVAIDSGVICSDSGPYARAKWVGGVLEVKCPHCGKVTTFPGAGTVGLYHCNRCGEEVEVTS